MGIPRCQHWSRLKGKPLLPEAKKYSLKQNNLAYHLGRVWPPCGDGSPFVFSVLSLPNSNQSLTRSITRGKIFVLWSGITSDTSGTGCPPTPRSWSSWGSPRFTSSRNCFSWRRFEKWIHFFATCPIRAQICVLPHTPTDCMAKIFSLSPIPRPGIKLTTALLRYLNSGRFTDWVTAACAKDPGFGFAT